MANLGVRALSNLVFPTGQDASWLANFQLEDGTTIQQVAADVDAALGSAAVWMRRRFSDLVYFTSDPLVDYRQGVTNGLALHTEFGEPNAYRADVTGHSLAYREYDRKLGWTWDYLRKARREQIEADIADIIKDLQDKFEAMLIRRCLNDAEDTGALNDVGNGYSPGWCLSGGTLTFTPPAVNGKTFASTHDHYQDDAGGAWTNAMFKTARADLMEHGHEPPYQFWINDTEEDTVRGLSDFTPTEGVGVRFGATQDVATVGSNFIGVIHDFYVKVVPRVPQYYGIYFKSYGANSQRNPIRCRVEKGRSAPWVRMIGSGAYTEFPIENMWVFTGFGFGAGDRTAGGAYYNNNASWTDATVTGAD